MKERKTTKTSVTRHQYLQIVGLLTVADRHNQAVQEIQNALRELTGEISDYGHCADAMYQPYTADQLLVKLDLKVRVVGK